MLDLHFSRPSHSHCPAHRNTEESLTIWENKDEHVGIKCYANCSRKAIVEAIGLTEQDLYRRDRPRAIYQAGPGITLLDLSIAKGIHPNVLINLDLTDMTYRGRDAVRIPYWLPDGTPYSRYRIRTALTAKEGSSWNKGNDPIIPYGLHRTALLMEGATTVIIDNITERLESKHLDAVLTSDIWRGRILGVSKMTRVPNRATWIATGNNIRLGGDLPGRCYRIRLDAHMSRPERRRGFKHPDLATWIKEHRANLVAALLTLARAWYQGGKPEDENLPAMRTFTGWVKIVGGILKYAGVPGFLTNLDALTQ